jgi:hypothetical protein
MEIDINVVERATTPLQELQRFRFDLGYSPIQENLQT